MCGVTKKGQFVVCMSKEFKTLNYGGIYEVQEVDQWENKFAIISGTKSIIWFSVSTRHFCLVDHREREKKEKKKKQSIYLYTFKASSPDAVDWSEVHKESVSRDKPIAVVKMKGFDRCVVCVHPSIIRKAAGMEDPDFFVPTPDIGLTPKLLFELETRGAFFGEDFTNSHLLLPREVSRIKEIVGIIKNAKWKRKSTTITVQQLEV